MVQTLGKIATLILNVFLRSLNSFQTRNFNCTAAEAPGAKILEAIFKTSACLFTFISQTFLPIVDKHAFYVFVSKAQNEQGVRSLEVGILRIISFRCPCRLLL